MLFSIPISKQWKTWGPSDAFGWQIIPFIIPFDKESALMEIASAHLRDPYAMRQKAPNVNRLPLLGSSDAIFSKSLIIVGVRAAACLITVDVECLFAAFING